MKYNDALYAYAGFLAKQYPDNPDIPFEVSEGFDKKICSLATKHRVKIGAVKKILLIAAVILVVAATTVFAVEPLRHMVQKYFEDHVAVYFLQQEKSRPVAVEVATPAEVPERFTLMQQNLDQEFGEYSYEYVAEEDSNQYLVITQSALENSMLNIDNEQNSIETLSVNGEEVKFANNGEMSTMYWADETSFCQIIGMISKNEAIAIFQSM